MPPFSYKDRIPLIATGIYSNVNTQIRITSERRQYYPTLRVFRIKQSQHGWIFIPDTNKEFAILQSEPKMQQVFGENIKVSLPRSYNFADATTGKVLVFKGVSSNVTIDDFKELLDYNKITHAEAERMKSRRSGRDLPFIKIKCENVKQASRGTYFVCQKTGIIFEVEEFRTTSSIQLCFKCQGVWAQDTKLYQKTEMYCMW